MWQLPSTDVPPAVGDADLAGRVERLEGELRRTREALERLAGDSSPR